ncbi:HPP family protein [Herbaspirillum sp. RTI4]|uniref:HPP family protein n=1 Tax=Herbaspirillum sp. RTI4 TaxID=3048640 RepID=UPI002AB3F1CE|nr:HPP family protein [Herbaspirillum sp. RTI4]MDY7577286.1 HPP family protein [Herbaspirillum sp. RTI4]MEA9982948.1 HPP family protein [Herbaspirillum sp. RTI4]
MTIKNRFEWVLAYFTAENTVDRFERMRACAGALIGITLTGLCSYLMLDNDSAALWLIAPMGASAVLLFAVPASPLAQPWSLVGGNLCSAFVGVTCAKLIGEPILAAGLAVALAIAIMFWWRCLHPPSGAIALTAVLGGPAVQHLGYHFLLTPVALNTLLLLLIGVLFNNATGRRYPHASRADPVRQQPGENPQPMARIGFSADDLDAVLRRYNQVLAISRDDLGKILYETEMAAYQRRFVVVTCKDIMSSVVFRVEFATTLLDAWKLLREHDLEALPVVGNGGHVIGMISRSDFIRHVAPRNYAQIEKKLRQLLRVVPRAHSRKPEVVGQIMLTDATKVRQDQPIVEIVALMSNHGHHVLPVVNDEGKLVGIISQTDLIAALYESRLRT